jgi:putative DNA primase/helicase
MKVVSITAAQVKPERVRWASRPRIPLGEPTILAGAPGIGKTQLAIGLCADATRGQLDGDLDGPSHVAYVSAEDSITYTLTPRFLAAGGDPRLIHFYQAKKHSTAHTDEENPSLELPADVPLLNQWLEETQARILVLDPFVAMLPPALNAHRDQHIRRAIAPLAAMSHKRNLVVLLILHLNKSQEGDALSRLSGSIGIGAAARSVLLFAPDPDDPDGETGNQRVLAHAKSNLGRKGRSLAYRIEMRVVESADGPIETSVAVERGEANVSAGDLLGNATSSTEAGVRTEARDFLLAELAGGFVLTTELRKRAEDAGIGWKTCERVKAQLGIRSRKNGSTWGWELKTTPHTPPGHVGGVGGDEKVTKIPKATISGGIESNGGVVAAARTDDELQALIDSAEAVA